MKYICVLLMVVAVAAVAARGEGQAGGAATAGVTPSGSPPAAAAAGPTEASPTGASAPEWSAGALQIAEQVAAKIRAGGVACNNFAPAAPPMFAIAEQVRIPPVAAVASCSTEGAEDLTFEVFADAKAAQEFVAFKQELLCRRMRDVNIADWVGFPYVDGGAWIIEPDDKDTAEQLAKILGVSAKMAGCSKGKPSPL